MTGEAFGELEAEAEAEAVDAQEKKRLGCSSEREQK